jgi:hypothetical protein
VVWARLDRRAKAAVEADTSERLPERKVEDMVGWVLVTLCVLVVLFWDHLQQTEGQEFEGYKKRFEKMFPAEREVAIGKLWAEARGFMRPTKYVTPQWGARREAYRRKERLILGLTRYFKDK